MTDEELLNTDILLPYQAAWLQDDSRIKIWEKSRRIGASYAEALDSVLEAGKDKKSGGQSTYYLSYNKEMTRQFVSDCAFWARTLNKAISEIEEPIIQDEDKDITVYRITFSSGCQIWGLPSKAHVLRSKQGRVVLDEAAFVEDLNALLTAAIALTMWGGVIRILSTHNGIDSQFNELISEVKDGKKAYSQHKTTISEALEKGLYKRICLCAEKEWSPEAEKIWLDDLLSDSGDGAAQELYCIPSRTGGHYISRMLVESCMYPDIPVLTYTCDDAFTFKSERHRIRKTERWIKDDLSAILADSPDKPSYIGMDFARSGDLSVIAIASEDTDRMLRAVVYIELRNTPFAQQFQILCYCIDNLKRFYSASLDARGNGQMMAEYTAQQYGPSSIHQVMPSRPFYMEYFPKYKAALEDNELFLPKSSEILDDHRTVKLDKGVPSVAEHTGSGSNKRHGDSVIAGVMLIHAKDNDEGYHGAYEYEGVDMKNPWKTGGAFHAQRNW